MLLSPKITKHFAYRIHGRIYVGEMPIRVRYVRTLEGESHLVTGGIVSDGRAVVAVLLLLRVIVMTLFAVMLNSLLCYLCDRHSIITSPPPPPGGPSHQRNYT